MAYRYYLTVPDPSRIDAAGAHAMRARGPEGMAEELQDALRTPALFERWRAGQDDPDDVDAGLGLVDASATVTGEQRDLGVVLIAVTTLNSTILRHRLELLVGRGAWQLRDVSQG